MRELKTWAWSEGVRNFGDELGPAILERLGYRVTRVENIRDADLLTIGSLLEGAAKAAAPGTKIWGSGLMDGLPVDVSHLDILAVRGTLTARAVGAEVPVGDPGCLVPELWSKPPTKRGLGVVRHYLDDREYPWADEAITANRPVDEVIAFIGSCERVASSSLHGLIVAASWGIPAVRLHHESVAGGDFKWADWLSGTGDPGSLLRALT